MKDANQKQKPKNTKATSENKAPQEPSEEEIKKLLNFEISEFFHYLK